MGASSSLASGPFETLKNQLQKSPDDLPTSEGGAIDELEGALKALKVLDVETPGADASQLLQEMQSCTLEAPKERLHFFRLLLKENVKKSQWAKVVGGHLKPCGHTCQILNKDLNCK